MQKKLIALAVAGVFAAPAFAATANVDVYGQLNVSVDFTDTDIANSDFEGRVTRVSNTASRFGVKGAEDLGGGLSGIWQIESGVTADSTAEQFTSRNVFVGLSSKSFGTVKLGKHDTPYKMATGRLDVFGDTLGDYNAIVGSFSHSVVSTRSTNTNSSGITTSSYTYSTTGNAAFDTRESNSIMYETPNLSGFSAAVMYGARSESGAPVVDTSAGTTVNTDAKLWSISANYASGPLYVAAAWEKHSDVFNDNGLAVGTLIDATAWKIGAAYTFGNLTAGLMYEKISLDSEFITGGSAGEADRNAWYASMAYKMGNVTLKGAYARASESDSGSDDGARQWTVGVDYALSKRTSVYALYTSLNADDNGLWTLGGNGTTGGQMSGIVNGATGGITEDGNDPSGFSIGVKHSF